MTSRERSSAPGPRGLLWREEVRARRRPRLSGWAVLTLLVSLVLTASLTSCGGGGSSPSTGSGSTATREPATAEAGISPPQAHHLSKAAMRKTRLERHAAGRAAPFVRPESDNSLPTFGTEAGASEQAAVEASLKPYLRARAAEDWAVVCRGLAVATREGYEKLGHQAGRGCAPILAALSKEADLGDPLNGGLLSLRVHGQNAFALFIGPGHQQYFVPLYREGGAWRPTQPGPIEYPPGATV
jgi:hypothetical protein